METPLAGHKEYLGAIFRRCVLALVGAHAEDCVFERGVLEQMVILAEERILELGAHLKRLSEMQRRRTPSLGDVALLLFLHNINWVDLEKEAARAPQLEQMPTVHALNSLLFDPNLADIDGPARVFFDTAESLAPATRPAPIGALPWMPELPPDHTYLQTASHPSEIRNLWQVRQNLVEESRLAERALQGLLGDKDMASFIEFNEKPRKPVQMTQSEENKPVNTAQPTNEETKMSELHEIKQELDDLSPSSRQTSQQANSPAPSSQTEGSVEPVRPLKLQLHMKLKPKEQAPLQPTPEPKPKLALRLSLHKPKRKREEFLGKRPRVDLVALAHKQAAKETNESHSNPSSPHKPQTPNTPPHTPPETDAFALALAAYTRTT